MKKCSKCNRNKPLADFYKDRRYTNRYMAACKKCKNLKSAEYYDKNKEKMRKKHREYYNKNIDKIRSYSKIWASENQDKTKIYWNRYYKKNREDIIERKSKYISYKWKIDPVFRVKSNMRCRINKALKNGQKNGSAIEDLGCSIEYFRVFIENKFYNHPRTDKKMNWDNYGEWHIDHIKPLASFDLVDKEQFLEACHYTNLQPLWACDNFSKGAK